MPLSMALGERETARDVAREDGGRQSVLGVVRERDRLIGAARARDRDLRREGFLAEQGHRRRHVIDHHALITVPLPSTGAMSPPTSTCAPCFTASPSKPLQAFDRRRADDGADDELASSGLPTGSAATRFVSRAGEIVGDFRVDDHALGRHADLAGVRVCAEHRGIHRRVEIGVIQHDERRLAAQLEQDRLQVFRRGLRQQLADAASSR